ncbi:putative FtsX-related transmembrane transport protein [Indibacter alkaliphilus LW1]|uniref:FtsX-related transmembrane transport protein n=1 Tax=Indibacter alkaliphilus (strain CCUG 57479 / KCTC 22604 / LW1) TaxID=1189612 RepID=S2DNF8_INDAL|nr:ABC transporter permease [Indibacter alkaliphilus]EOZ98765.1 putative FtsX-related transmembrane transport protein [Indibacter alkaliphilus LW1]
MLINILGLSVGMAASILIFLFVQHELSYDKYHDKSDRIYRISRSFFNQNGEVNLHLGHLAPPFGPLLKSDFNQDVEEVVRVLNTNVVLKDEGNVFEERRFYFSDPEVFNVFTWEVIEGDPEAALSFPDGMVISESMAKKYFGNSEAIGRTLEMKIGQVSANMQVRAVMKDVPDNSHFKADFLASMELVTDFYGGYEAMMKNFGSNNFGTYMLLKPGVDIESITAQIPSFLNRHLQTGNDGTLPSTWTDLHPWAITDIHLYSNLDSELEPNSSIEYVYIYSAIAIFILLIACVNFMNLATARSAKRALEVGLRKVLGADRQLLIRQFMSETIMMTFMALVLAVALATIALPVFGDFTGKELSMNLLDHPEYLLGMLALVVLVGMLAGSYPSLFLSGFQPVKVLKGTYKIGSIHEKLRSALVVGQFAISIILIVAVMVVINQLDYMKNKELGFNKEQIVVLPAYKELVDNYETLRDRFLQQPGIESMALGSRIPSGRLLDAQGAQAEVNGELTVMDIRLTDIHISHSFMETFGINMAAGRDFDYQLASDSTEAFLINESAVRAIGWASSEDAIGKAMHYGPRRGYVVGVVKDFHFESLHQPISPMIFMVPDERFNEVAFRLNADNFDQSIAYLREEWTALRPDFPFNYYSVADRFDQQYEAEEKVGTVFGFFAGLAILISILGLFGLSAYATEQRTKEIGVRKVMGASILSVVLLLGKDFLKLVLMGFVLAVPIAWYGMSNWLDGFAYSISLSWLVFLISGFIALFIAALTVSSQSIRAAMINPVDAFKVE